MSDRTIEQQLARLDAGEPVDAAAVMALPTLDKEAALRAWPCPVHLGREGVEARRHSYIAYRKRLARLRRHVRRVAEEERQARVKRGAFHRVRSDPDLWLQMLDSPSQPAVLEPRAMPVDVPRVVEDFKPIMCRLKERRGRPAASQEVFTRGALYSDGRVDMCKQVPGPAWIEQFVRSVADDAGASVRHFLMGNSVVGRRGADAIAAYVRRDRPAIETWYLAGNELDAGCAEQLCGALKDDPHARALWLKRNPLGADGARHVADMLRGSNQIRVLDLSNTALGDEGLRHVAEALRDNSSLRVLYLDANGITPAGAVHLYRLLAGGRCSLTHLYVCMNPLGDDGARLVAQGLEVYDRLEVLAMSSCRMGPAGLYNLCEALWPSESLRVLNVGHYKATADMGELPNSFGAYGAHTLCRFVQHNRRVEVLDFSVTHVPDAAVRGVAQEVLARRARGEPTVRLLVAHQYGFPTGAATGGLLTNVRSLGRMSVQEKRVLCHTEDVVNIDSMYRNSM